MAKVTLRDVLDIFLECNHRKRYLISCCTIFKNCHHLVSVPLPLSGHGLLAISFDVYRRVALRAVKLDNGACYVLTESFDGSWVSRLSPDRFIWDHVRIALLSIAKVSVRVGPDHVPCLPASQGIYYIPVKADDLRSLLKVRGISTIPTDPPRGGTNDQAVRHRPSRGLFAKMYDPDVDELLDVWIVDAFTGRYSALAFAAPLREVPGRRYGPHQVYEATRGDVRTCLQFRLYDVGMWFRPLEQHVSTALHHAADGRSVLLNKMTSWGPLSGSVIRFVRRDAEPSNLDCWSQTHTVSAMLAQQWAGTRPPRRPDALTPQSPTPTPQRRPDASSWAVLHADMARHRLRLDRTRGVRDGSSDSEHDDRDTRNVRARTSLM